MRKLTPFSVFEGVALPFHDAPLESAARNARKMLSAVDPVNGTASVLILNPPSSKGLSDCSGASLEMSD
jgi:hypothetical protein